MDEKELTTEQTAQEPKKPTKKKSTKKQEPTATDAPETTTSTEQVPTIQDASQPEPEPGHGDSATTENAPEQTTSENWNFYNQLQSVETKDSHGGSNKTHPVRRRAQKRAHKTRIQKESRRINRYIK